MEQEFKANLKATLSMLAIGFMYLLLNIVFYKMRLVPYELFLKNVEWIGLFVTVGYSLGLYNLLVKFALLKSEKENKSN